MSAAILAISPQPPPLAFALWLGAAGLSVCGLFLVQYFAILFFPIQDEDLRGLVEDGNEVISTRVLAAVAASPVLITLWASVLFLVGVVDYVVETEFGGSRKYRVLALVPVLSGVGVVVGILAVGETLGRRVRSRLKEKGFRNVDIIDPDKESNRTG